MACIHVSALSCRSLGDNAEPGESARRRRQRKPWHAAPRSARTAVENRAVVERSLRWKGVNQFGVHDEVAAEHQDRASVVRCAAVVRRGEERDQLALREALESCVLREY